MQDFKARLEKEILELVEKIVKLKKFIDSNDFLNIDSEQKGLLYAQFQVMKSYHLILEKRFSLLK